MSEVSTVNGLIPVAQAAVVIPKIRLDKKIRNWWRGKITPLHDLSWYIKWTGSLMIMVAVACRGLGYPPIFDFVLSIGGTALWLAVGFLWRDRSLIAMNVVITLFLVIGLLRITG